MKAQHNGTHTTRRNSAQINIMQLTERGHIHLHLLEVVCCRFVLSPQIWATVLPLPLLAPNRAGETTHWDPPEKILLALTRWPGSATSNTTFNNDDLLDRELVTIGRLIGLSSKDESGVKIVPALKVSRKADNTWNRRPLDEGRLSAASEVQRNMRMIAQPKNVSKEDINAFKATGYKTVDETQVVRIETGKYFKFLIDTITASGGSVEIGTYLTKEEVEQLKKSCHVVNCLGNNAGKVGGGSGEYYSNPGECVMWKRCPRNFGFYVMDDDQDAGVMQDPTTGDLYLSTAAKAGPDQTKNTVADCDGVCMALFGQKMSLDSGDGFESWKTDRPMRKEGFNICAEKSMKGLVAVENSGHGGAGVAASWACAARAADALLEKVGGARWG